MTEIASIDSRMTQASEENGRDSLKISKASAQQTTFSLTPANVPAVHVALGVSFMRLDEYALFHDSYFK